ncbi:MAG: hypothetical protein KA191_16005 [Verrucomicrobia bacterium]|jgi:type VI protein secretion system component VasF|nr:hypothetical protein [Verrucomicrobiota bacterium]
MKQIQVAVLSETSNCPVVQLPDRKYPGVVLQGDSLRILLDSAEEIRELSAKVQDAELSDAVASLKEKLAGYVSVFEQTMKANGRDLPYPTIPE